MRSTHPFSAATWRRALVERPLVVAISRSYLGHGLSRDDLIDEGLIGVCRAVETFDPALGEWPAHASRHAENAIKEAVYHGQLVRRTARSLWKAGPVRPCGDPLTELLPGRGDRIPPGEWAEAEAALRCLDEQERGVVAGRCGLHGPERTLREIGGELGRTRQWVARVEQRAVAKLRRAVEEAP